MQRIQELILNDYNPEIPNLGLFPNLNKITLRMAYDRVFRLGPGQSAKSKSDLVIASLMYCLFVGSWSTIEQIEGIRMPRTKWIRQLDSLPERQTRNIDLFVEQIFKYWSFPSGCQFEMGTLPESVAVELVSPDPFLVNTLILP